MLGHTNGFDEHVQSREGKKTCLVKVKLSLKPVSSILLPPPFFSLLVLLFTSSSSSSSSSLGLQSIWKNKSHLLSIWPLCRAVIPPHILQLPKHPWTIHSLHPSQPYPPVTLPPTPPLPALIPIPGLRGGIQCQCPRKTPLSGTCGGSAAVLFRGLSFTVWDSHSSAHVCIASQVQEI